MIEVPKTQAQWVDVVVDCQREDVVLALDGQPLAILMSAERHRRLLERLQEALDELAVALSSAQPDYVQTVEDLGIDDETRHTDKPAPG